LGKAHQHGRRSDCGCAQCPAKCFRREGCGRPLFGARDSALARSRNACATRGVATVVAGPGLFAQFVDLRFLARPHRPAPRRQRRGGHGRDGAVVGLLRGLREGARSRQRVVGQSMPTLSLPRLLQVSSKRRAWDAAFRIFRRPRQRACQIVECMCEACGLDQFGGPMLLHGACWLKP